MSSSKTTFALGANRRNDQMRTINHHHDGHGLNEQLLITADAPDASGASHHYKFSMASAPGGVAGFIQFQQGPRSLPNSVGGALNPALLAVLIDRQEGFQSGPFACPENQETLDLLKKALASMRARADARAARGVLGKNEK